MKHLEKNSNEHESHIDDVYARAIKEAIARELASLNFTALQEAS